MSRQQLAACCAAAAGIRGIARGNNRKTLGSLGGIRVSRHVAPRFFLAHPPLPNMPEGVIGIAAGAVPGGAIEQRKKFRVEAAAKITFIVLAAFRDRAQEHFHDQPRL